MDVHAAGRTVAISNPDKVFFPERGETKVDLVRYFLALEAPVMRAIGGRPVLMERYPDGAGGKSFFQKRVPKGAPDWLRTLVVQTPNGTPSEALVAQDIAHVAWAVNLGCLGFHAWPVLADDPEHADELRIDLDPQPGVTLPMVREAAGEARALLEEAGLVGFATTTGRDGIHIHCPLTGGYDSLRVRAGAVAFARELERRRPDLVTAQWWKEDRGVRVFVDFNQNAPHKTMFAAWGARPRPGGQVACPFRWEDLPGIDPEVFTIATVPALVAEGGDPWEGMEDHRRGLDALLAWSERDLAGGLMDAPWPPVYPKMPGEPPRVSRSRAKKPGT